MTTEDDFQNALDAHPDDWQTRLVFADWLQERGDARAEGYRALGVMRRVPIYYGLPQTWGYWSADFKTKMVERHAIADDWLNIDGFRLLGHHSQFSKEFRSRREAEDAAALAFAKLPAERRAELLASQPTGV